MELGQGSAWERGLGRAGFTGQVPVEPRPEKVKFEKSKSLLAGEQLEEGSWLPVFEEEQGARVAGRGREWKE